MKMKRICWESMSSASEKAPFQPTKMDLDTGSEIRDPLLKRKLQNSKKFNRAVTLKHFSMIGLEGL